MTKENSVPLTPFNIYSLWHANETCSHCRRKKCTPFTVSYVLVDPVTSNEYSFSGWPDFVIAKRSVRAGLLLIALGEVESQRNDAAAQLGIYAIGEFQRQNTRNPLTCVAIYKNKSASVYLASLTRDTSHATVGTVSFQLVNTPQANSLMDAEDIQLFAEVLVGTLLFAETT